MNTHMIVTLDLLRSRPRHWSGDPTYSGIASRAGSHHNPTPLTDIDSPAATVTDNVTDFPIFNI